MKYQFDYKLFGNYPELSFASGNIGNDDFNVQVHRIIMPYDPYKWLATLIIRYRFLVIPINKTVSDIASAKIKWVSPEGVKINVADCIHPSPAWRCIDWGGPHRQQQFGCSGQIDYPLVPYINNYKEQTHAVILAA